MRKKCFLTLALAALMALSLAACGGEEAKRQETTVRYGIAGAWDSLMPYNSVSASNYARLIYDKLYDRLVFVHEDGSLSPRAAESWESVDGGMAAVFHLNQNAVFHDGVPATAQCWVDTFRLMTNPECPTLGRSQFSVFAGTDENGAALSDGSVAAEALDEWTLKLTFKSITTPEEFLLARNREFYVLPMHLLEDVAPADVMAMPLWEAPVGSGPLMFEEELVGSRLTLTANTDYQLGAPGFDKLVITVMDKSSLLTSLISGDLDYYAIGASVSDENAEAARQAGLTVLEGEIPTSFFELMLNNETVPASIRQAIDLALDKELLCEQNTGELGVVTDTSMLSGAGHSTWRRDVGAAKELVASTPMDTRELMLATTSNRAGLAALMQQNLAEAGITVTIETVDSATLFSGMTDGAYDLAIASHTPSALPLWFTESRLKPGNNIFHIGEEALQRYAVELSAIHNAADDEARGAAIKALEEHLAEEKPFLPLWFARSLHVQSPTVEGIDYGSASCSNENVWAWSKA